MAVQKYFLLVLIVALAQCDKYHPKPKEQEKQIEFQDINPLLKDIEGHHAFWDTEAKKYLNDRLRLYLTRNRKKAKNIIMFIGDGLSLPTTAATRMYLGGEEVNLSFENFPYYGLVKTYCVDRQVSDSACTATAFLCGVKNTYNGIGLSANVSRSQCNFSEEDIAYSIVKWAQDAGKSTGIVTTTRVTHATPAAAYAHIPHRSWENNAAISSACRDSPTSQIVDIAHQFVYNEEAKKLNVVLGCGTRHFLNSTMRNEEGVRGWRTDGRNLIEEWLQERGKEGNARYVWHKGQLDVVDYDKTDYLLGLFEDSHCMYRLDIIDNKLEQQEPLLTQMTESAIRMLQKNKEKGFFLLVESGRIDHAHHANQARKALDETAEFARSIELARRMTSEEDTLIVVTSDHSHVFAYAGYPTRHSDILRLTGENADDGLPYETLSYTNGPGYERTWDENGTRVDMANDNFADINRRYSSMVPLSSETHAGEDIAVYANGPWSHLFQGSYEQSDIAIAMAYAAKIGPYFDEGETNSGRGIYLMPMVLVLCMIIQLYFS